MPLFRHRARNMINDSQKFALFPAVSSRLVSVNHKVTAPALLRHTVYVLVLCGSLSNPRKVELVGHTEPYHPWIAWTTPAPFALSPNPHPLTNHTTHLPWLRVPRKLCPLMTVPRLHRLPYCQLHKANSVVWNAQFIHASERTSCLEGQLNLIQTEEVAVQNCLSRAEPCYLLKQSVVSWHTRPLSSDCRYWASF